MAFCSLVTDHTRDSANIRLSMKRCLIDLTCYAVPEDIDLEASFFRAAADIYDSHNRLADPTAR